MKHKCVEHLNSAQIMARAAYRRINDTFVDFFRDLGGCENLPSEFDVSGEGWIEAERLIDEAAQLGEIEKTIALCRQYERRALAYFDAWRKRLGKPEKQKGAIA